VGATLAGAAGVAWSAGSLWWPVVRRVRTGDALLSAAARGRRAEVWELAGRYASADPLDALAARDASRAALWATPREQGALRSAGLELADALATEAVRRDGSSPAAWRHLAMVRTFAQHGDAYAMPGQAPPSADAGLVDRLRDRVARRRGDRIAAHDLAMQLTAAEGLGEAYALLSRIAAQLPGSPSAAFNAGDAAWRLGRKDDAVEHWSRGGRLWLTEAPGVAEAESPAWMVAWAVGLNPQSIRLRIDSADAYSRVGRLAAARFEIANARRIDGALLGQSVEKLTPREQRRLELIEARASAVRSALPEPPVAAGRFRAMPEGGR
jgi:tetratricopeptide (TPR) repeat protein